MAGTVLAFLAAGLSSSLLESSDELSFLFFLPPEAGAAEGFGVTAVAFLVAGFSSSLLSESEELSAFLGATAFTAGLVKTSWAFFAAGL